MREFGTATCSACAPQPHDAVGTLLPHATSDLDVSWQASDTYHIGILTETLEVTEGSKLPLPRHFRSRYLVASLHDGGAWGRSKRHRSCRTVREDRLTLRPVLPRRQAC